MKSGTIRFIFPPAEKRCLKCGEMMEFQDEYARGHYLFFCHKCKEWGYIP